MEVIITAIILISLGVGALHTPNHMPIDLAAAPDQDLPVLHQQRQPKPCTSLLATLSDIQYGASSHPQVRRDER